VLPSSRTAEQKQKQKHGAKAKAKAWKSSRAGRRLHGKCYFSDLLFGVGVAC